MTTATKREKIINEIINYYDKKSGIYIQFNALDLAKTLKLSRGSITSTLIWLKKQGAIMTVGRGQYEQNGIDKFNQFVESFKKNQRKKYTAAKAISTPKSNKNASDIINQYTQALIEYVERVEAERDEYKEELDKLRDHYNDLFYKYEKFFKNPVRQTEISKFVKISIDEDNEEE